MNGLGRTLRSARTYARAVTALVVLLLCAPSAWADTVVYPTGIYPTDVQAVQAAVNGGGTVRLKAVNVAGEPTAFNFGPPVTGSGRVRLSTDVQIRGEARASAKTTIRGGDAPFFGDLPVRSAITGISFVGPRLAALYVLASSGVEFTHNVVTDVTGIPWSFGYRKGQGVWILGAPGGGVGPITGTVTIAHNTIANINAEDGIGLTLVGFEADMNVIGNDIRGTNFIGILAFGHSGRVLIQDNTVIPGAERFAAYSGGNAIQVGPLWADDQIPDTAPALIWNNRVVAENPNADGIVVYGGERPLNGSWVVGNQVTMRNSLYGGITLFDNTSHTILAGNQVRGNGAFGISMVTFDFPEQRGNVVVGNDIARFEATDASVFLGEWTADTLVLGCQGTVVDLGTNNHVVGCARGVLSELRQRLSAPLAPGLDRLRLLRDERRPQ